MKPFFKRFLYCVVDLPPTLILWFYFIFGYLFALMILYGPVYLRIKDRRSALQKLNHLYLKGFFALLRWVMPRVKINIPDSVRKIHSAIIICNHLSYLDPILLVSLFPRQKTIVKSTFFKVPIFGWFLKQCGYLSSASGNRSGATMIDHLEDIKGHLEEGGVLFIFPEGTRSRDGKLLPFNKGVFTIARYCSAPLYLVLIRGTDRLFQPGHFLLNAHEAGEVTLEIIGSLKPNYRGRKFSLSAMAEEARKIFEEKIAHYTIHS